MDRWKSRGGKIQRREEQKGEDRRRSEKRKSEKKEDAGARKGSKVAIHCVFPMICVSGRSESRLAKAGGAEPSGQMRDEKLHAVVAWSTFGSQKSKVQKTDGHGALLDVQMSFRVAGARGCAPCQKWAKRDGFVAVSTTTTTTLH